MSCTATEFRLALQNVFGDAVSVVPDGLLISTPEASLHFALSEQNPLRIAALRLDRMRVEISVRAGDETAAERLLSKVDRATLRGGG
jgi:hypothetical protein